MYIRNLILSVLVVFFTTLTAYALPHCPLLFSQLKKTVYGRLANLDFPVEFSIELQNIFEKHIAEMLADLTPEQQVFAAQEISQFDFRDSIDIVGKFDFYENRILMNSFLRGKILALTTLMHEARHYLDFNFREQPKNEMVWELETRAFRKEYQFIKEIMQLRNAPDILSSAIAKDAKLSTEERFFLEYLFRNSQKYYDSNAKKFLLGRFVGSEKIVAQSTFKKLHAITLTQLHTFFQVANLSEQGFLDLQLLYPSYWAAANAERHQRMLGEYRTRWGYVQGVSLIYTAYLLAQNNDNQTNK